MIPLSSGQRPNKFSDPLIQYPKTYKSPFPVKVGVLVYVDIAGHFVLFIKRAKHKGKAKMRFCAKRRPVPLFQSYMHTWMYSNDFDYHFGFDVFRLLIRL